MRARLKKTCTNRRQTAIRLSAENKTLSKKESKMTPPNWALRSKLAECSLSRNSLGTVSFVSSVHMQWGFTVRLDGKKLRRVLKERRAMPLFPNLREGFAHSINKRSLPCLKQDRESQFGTLCCFASQWNHVNTSS